ncbi:TorD/DmsD family molecular chaperone [Geminicoccus harenae]|uniref:TorD/DmsD family molecular chaperone n=1 Tax=Geminicoccus harenae TaxID=2498453 RepID=UPI00168A6CB1|nr:molecular chaperone TorD family protein [Geminicoccus harenae]
MGGEPSIDEIDLLRAHEYHLLALLLGRQPTAELLARLAGLEGDGSPLGQAHAALAEAAATADPAVLERAFFDLFIGIGRSELIPHASYYLTGFLHERPLVGIRQDMAALGIERAAHVHEPEDHLAILCETMAGLASGRFDAGRGSERQFFRRHLEPWAGRFFGDLEQAASTPFYRSVGTVGRLFMEIEASAFAMDVAAVSPGAERRAAG